jgi:hypothetical protein
MYPLFYSSHLGGLALSSWWHYSAYRAEAGFGCVMVILIGVLPFSVTREKFVEVYGGIFFFLLYVCI